jgi:hypothetical protein
MISKRPTWGKRKIKVDSRVVVKQIESILGSWEMKEIAQLYLSLSSRLKRLRFDPSDTVMIGGIDTWSI